MKQLYDYYFWFSQPSSVLSRFDSILGYCFAGAFILAMILLFVARFAKHGVYIKLIRKFGWLSFTVGISGLLWYGLRYENTPIFAKRFWAGIVLVMGVIWVGFILKYLIFNFRSEKSEFDREMIKNKYLGGKAK